MEYTWQHCAAGSPDGKGYLDFGTIGVSQATSSLLKGNRVQSVAFGVAVLNLDAQATFILEGRIGGYWFSLPTTQIIVTPTGDPEVNRATGLLTYDHCASIEAIRCRFFAVDAGALTPTADVIAMGVKVAD